jgi:hypothetical protein
MALGGSQGLVTSGLEGGGLCESTIELSSGMGLEEIRDGVE